MHDPVKITLLVDNEALEGLEKEHGFAAWIEAGSRRILFDTGQLGALQVNAERLGVNLKDADQQRLGKTFEAMSGWKADFLIPCHCTGENAAKQMYDTLGGSIVTHGQAGMAIEAGRLAN